MKQYYDVYYYEKGGNTFIYFDSKNLILYIDGKQGMHISENMDKDWKKVFERNIKKHNEVIKIGKF